MKTDIDATGQRGVSAAIFLGASEFLSCEMFAPNPSFLRSKEGIRDYLQSSTAGLGISDDATLDLFNSPALPNAQLKAIGVFVNQLKQRAGPAQLKNLFVYYVGHGFFKEPNQDYYLALAGIELDYETTTALKVADLAVEVKNHAQSFRRFIILDCCFAAEALAQFQAVGATEAIARKADSSFEEKLPFRVMETPLRGTALFCAADKDNVARSPLNLERTLFSDALLRALQTGDTRLQAQMNLHEVYDLMWEQLRYIPDTVRPALHAPDQSQGDLSKLVRLFPNASAKALSSSRTIGDVSPSESPQTGFVRKDLETGDGVAGNNSHLPVDLFPLVLKLLFIQILNAAWYFSLVNNFDFPDSLLPLGMAQLLLCLFNMIAICKVEKRFWVCMAVGTTLSSAFTIPYLLFGGMFQKAGSYGLLIVASVIAVSGILCFIWGLAPRRPVNVRSGMLKK